MLCCRSFYIVCVARHNTVMSFKMEKVLVFIVLVSNQMVDVGSVGRKDVFSTNTLLLWLNQSTMHQWSHMDRNINFAVSSTNCRAIHLNMVVRHAAHFPARQKMLEMTALHEKIVTSKDPEKFSELNKWRKPLLDVADQITHTGWDELYNMGNRIGKGFKGLFNNFQNTYKFLKFVSSSDQKAIRSSKQFYDGLSVYMNKLPSFTNEINDSMVRFSEGCFNHKKQQQDEVVFLKQYLEFLKTTEFTDIVESVRKKLGLQMNLTAADIFLMNDYCAYGMYISGDITWCSLLSDDDRLVLEYGQDLLNYYKYSYGHPINAKMSCSLVRDIFNTMDGAINKNWNYFIKEDMSLVRYIGGKFQFGHADTIIPLVTALGLFKDKEPLLASNMAAMKDRKFKTSQISPFTGSVDFMLYACDNARRLALDEWTPGQQEFRIQAFVNEISVPLCGFDNCLYDEVKQNLKDFIETCNMTEICGVNRDITTQNTTLSSGMYSVNCTGVTFYAFIIMCMTMVNIYCV